MKKVQDNHITTTCAPFVRLLSICMALNDWKKKLQICSIYSSIKWMDWAQSIPRSPHERYSHCWRSANSQHSPVWYRCCGWKHCWRTCKTKCAELWNTVRRLRYNNHICYVNNINAVFQSFRCPNCGIFFNRTFNLEQHLTTCSERVKNVYPLNVYQIRKTLFDKLDSFGIKYTSEQKLFKNLAIFDFESICVQEETLRDTSTTTWIEKHVPVSVSISSNLVKEPIFFCNSDPHHLVAPFIGAFENLASQSKAKMKSLFLDIKTAINIKVRGILEKLTQRHSRRESARFDLSQDDCDNEVFAWTQFLQIQKNQNNWSSRISGTLLQCFNCVWFQQCKIGSQLNQILFATHSC